MPSQYILTEEQVQTLNETFVPLFLNAQKEERKDILRDAVKAIEPTGIDQTALLRLEMVSKIIIIFRWTLI